MSAVDPVPELVERALSELEQTTEQIRSARNDVAEAMHIALRTHDVLLQLRRATNSIAQIEHPEDDGTVNIVLPTPEALLAQRHRRVVFTVWAVAILLLAVVLVVA